MKRILISFAGALILTLAGMLCNYLSFRANRWLKLAYTGYGGEITIQHGFGLRMVHIYSMAPGESDSVTLTFNLFSFLFCLVVLFLIICLLVTAYEKWIGRKR